ncbi:MAG: glycoside hydrolase family 5 [Flammeovirgaceae bacterium]|nr:glycoside hydrolase family 5 [Flammeovirgaceae bacterium]MBE62117.1 glycoside hydrolase family 5 [Flammeovirgaceae bacterium]
MLKKSNFQNSHLSKALGLSLVLLLWSCMVSAQYLRADGTKIVDEDGEEFIWRGIGLGGWMLQEGYMLRTSGPQHEIEAKIEALIGPTKTREFYEAWWANHMRKIDVDSMASWGYNMIRLPMHYKLFTPPIEDEPVTGEITWNDKGFEMVDELLEWCKGNDIYLILDLHATPGGQGENADISDYDPTKPSLWESTENQDKMVALWRKLADRYKDEPMIGAYDIINEPNWGFQNHEDDPNGCGETQNTLLWNLQKRITEAIREVDEKHIIVIEGNCWGNNYNGLPALWDDNLVISYHKYWNANTQGAIQGMLDMRTSRNAPIWLGETGENSNTWFTNAVSLFEENSMGWSWWPLKKLGGNNPLQIPMNDGYQKILNYWNGSGSKPSEEDAFAALMQLAEDLKLENNIYHPDVVDAKIRQPHTDETLPFKPHHLTSKEFLAINFSDYDLGKSEFAYSDTEVTNTTGNAGGQAWNLGYAYRNDGVDIEETQDDSEFSNGYNVGWTEDGEWMLYTVKVDSSAAYDLTIRYAGQSGGFAHLEIDGINVTGPIELTATGGYQVWGDKVIEKVPLNKGDHKIKFVIEKGGSNLSYFGFFLTAKLTDIAFEVVSGKTTEDGLIILDLNKELMESSTLDGFTLSVNGNESEINTVQIEGDYQVSLEASGILIDTDELSISYSGSGIKATDGTSLESFSELSIANNLPYHIPIPGKIEAEDFIVNQGLELETTSDLGGGQNVGYTSTGDYLDYQVAIAETGTYKLEVRVACESNSGKIQFQQLNEEGAVLNKADVAVPVTGGWQTWETVSGTIDLDQARGILRMKILDPEFNVNWFKLTSLTSGPLAEKTLDMVFHPNPARDSFEILIPNASGLLSLEIFTMDGRKIRKTQVANGDKVDVSKLDSGVYLVDVWNSTQRFKGKIIIE